LQLVDFWESAISIPCLLSVDERLFLVNRRHFLSGGLPSTPSLGNCCARRASRLGVRAACATPGIAVITVRCLRRRTRE
jgi:hypothetical protein